VKPSPSSSAIGQARPGAYFGVHLYIHVPFCARRCSYCDFAIAVRRDVPSDTFVDLILREWAARRDEPESGRNVLDTVYLGGGTPSRLAPAAVARLLSGLQADRPLAPDAEVTIEANPDDVTEEGAAAWRAAGVNRVSLGVQSFDPAVLAWMHRTHSAAQASAAVAVLRRAGIDNLSLDLIFGLPAALGRDWTQDLAAALVLAPDHLSLYGLTVEPHTPLGRWTDRGEVTPVDEDRYAAEFLAAHSAVSAAGMEHYEVSNAARPGRRARHNSAYWRRAPFLGLGPSAHSGWGCYRRWNLREWTAYQRAAGAGQSLAGPALMEGEERLDDAAVALEQAYLGLRTTDGVPASHLPDDAVGAWTRSGWAVTGPDSRVRLTPEGWLRLDALVPAAMA
jgi:oxygen-independent coproporphyrinogen-3 oxidase